MTGWNAIEEDPFSEEEDDLTESLLGKGKEDVSLEDSSGFFSALFFSWLSPMLRSGSEKPLQFDDLPFVSRQNGSVKVLEAFEVQWRREEGVLGSVSQ